MTDLQISRRMWLLEACSLILYSWCRCLVASFFVTRHLHSPVVSSVPSILWPRRKMKQNIHFLSQIIISNSFKFLFIIMSLKMAALCPDASLDTLQPLCYRGTHHLKGVFATAFTRDLFRLSRLLWRFRQAMSSKTAHSL